MKNDVNEKEGKVKMKCLAMADMEETYSRDVLEIPERMRDPEYGLYSKGAKRI